MVPLGGAGAGGGGGGGGGKRGPKGANLAVFCIPNSYTDVELHVRACRSRACVPPARLAPACWRRSCSLGCLVVASVALPTPPCAAQQWAAAVGCSSEPVQRGPSRRQRCAQRPLTRAPPHVRAFSPPPILRLLTLLISPWLCSTAVPASGDCPALRQRRVRAGRDAPRLGPEQRLRLRQLRERAGCGQGDPGDPRDGRAGACAARGEGEGGRERRIRPSEVICFSKGGSSHRIRIPWGSSTVFGRAVPLLARPRPLVQRGALPAGGAAAAATAFEGTLEGAAIAPRAHTHAHSSLLHPRITSKHRARRHAPPQPHSSFHQVHQFAEVLHTLACCVSAV